MNGGGKIVISQMPGRTGLPAVNKDIYKWRHLIENSFCKFKEFKRILMRSDEPDTSFTVMIHLGAPSLHSQQRSTVPRGP